MNTPKGGVQNMGVLVLFIYTLWNQHKSQLLPYLSSFRRRIARPHYRDSGIIYSAHLCENYTFDMPFLAETIALSLDHRCLFDGSVPVLKKYLALIVCYTALPLDFWYPTSDRTVLTFRWETKRPKFLVHLKK